MKKFLSTLLVLTMLLGSVAFAESTPAGDGYTYNIAAETFATNWNPHQMQTANDSEITDYLQNGFYTFDYNEAEDGYVMVPVAAVDFPVDVTADYVGEDWGIKADEKGRAYKIVLRDNLKWQDGTPITANDFVKSAELLLNPKAQNYRADSLYSGNMKIMNAEAFLKQGLADNVSFKGIINHEASDLEKFLAAHGTEKGLINWKNSFGDTYDFEAKAWTGAADDKIVETPLTVQELYTFYTEGEGAKFATWATADDLKKWAYDELFVSYMKFPDAMTFDKVGVKALSDTELVLVLETSLEGFYLHYGLTGSWLVNEKLYNACTTETDGVYNNTYGTSAENTISWGPYTLESFQSDKMYRLAKNEHWFGNEVEDMKDQYMTTAIQVDFVKEASTRLEMFLNGKLDSNGLNKDQMVDYATSDYTYYSEGDSVFAMVFNPNLDALKASQETAGENINKTIVTVKEFRMAMSMAMNRAEFALATAPTNGPAFALYGSQIVSDPDKGEFYRTTELAKDVILNFWGLADEVGEGKLYATKEDAIESISGYNLEMARIFFDAAYDKAIEEGLLKDTDTVEIMIGTPNATSVFYNNGYDFIVNNYTEAVKGTKLEGKLTFKRDSTLGNGFSDALKSNQVDMLFGVGWTGSTFDPYGLMEAYVSPSYQYDPAWVTTEEMLVMPLAEGTYEANVYDWSLAIQGSTIKASVVDAEGKVTEETKELSFPYSTDPVKAQERLEVLAALENIVLQNYDFIPLINDAGANLKGMQIEYYMEDEVFPMGRGGVKYMTYNYTDAEWDAYVQEQGGTLNYK